MIVITGASDGLGKELASLYINEGKTVICLSRSTPAPSVTHIKTDLRDPASIQHAAEEILATTEPLEAVVNAAGILSIEPIEKLTPEQVTATLQTNIRAPLLLTSMLMKRIKKDGADIVNVASTVGTKAYSDQAVYGASKWALRGFSANLQMELKNYPCRVISFCPGGFKTKLFEKATGIDNTDKGSWMSPTDLAMFIKQILDLPKNMEVSEVIINRK